MFDINNINMKKIQLVLRILTSPLIFALSLAAMIIFPGTMAFLMAVIVLFNKLVGGDVDDSYNEIITMMFMFIIYPVINTKHYILTGNFVE
jgi:hypothetical protein